MAIKGFWLTNFLRKCCHFHLILITNTMSVQTNSCISNRRPCFCNVRQTLPIEPLAIFQPAGLEMSNWRGSKQKLSDRLELGSEGLKSFSSHSSAFFFSILLYFIPPPLPVFGRLWCCLRSVLTLACFHPFWHFASFIFFSLLVCKAAGQYQGVSYPFADDFLNLSSPCLPQSLTLSAFLSFSCGSLGSHALRLYRCLWGRRRPAVSN